MRRQYVLASLQWAFGENSGNPTADKIHAALQRARKNGMTRTEISEYVFNRRTSSHDITEALSLLKREGKANIKRLPNPAGKGLRWKRGLRLIQYLALNFIGSNRRNALIMNKNRNKLTYFVNSARGSQSRDRRER